MGLMVADLFSKKMMVDISNLDKNDFTIDYTDGKKYFIKYTIDNDAGSYCMVGEMIKIAELKEK